MAKPGKITQLDNDYTKRVRQSHQKKTVLTARRKKRALIIGGFFLVFVLIFGVQIVRTKMALGDTRQAITQSQKNLTEAKADNKALTQKVALLNDRDYLDKLIRAKYYYSKSNETIYSLPSDKTTDVSVK
ncbi:septum formation initiator family protein [Secundilactobacillus kimchicus]|uniref:Septum formation initiator n=1 Tax=Secundilactobacillus kimchicus JCM 15530 TaxID=1302272 RepID=A0A0R1HUP7_9LACO|nr:septum formation initiator family protein [Secundilactobacillus kimchicus]KRK47034.1 hypothetical protein FC96_GL000800 [Secundilactobacillus kimchicus JCM 15530]MBT9670707.1 septum formation initiator family protein [Secundilactobacillus kimchicus]